ncbi:hypothetical protein GCM10010272_34200 [Streptomyces lateritius]|nr:hypothetical protein GCM10010272_34200 [Streptomyces lateritius]
MSPAEGGERPPPHAGKAHHGPDFALPADGPGTGISAATVRREGVVTELSSAPLTLRPARAVPGRRIEEYGAVAEPLVILKIPDHPDPGESPAGKTTQAVPVLPRDVTGTVRPYWSVARDPEIEHGVMLPGFLYATPARTRWSRGLRWGNRPRSGRLDRGQAPGEGAVLSAARVVGLKTGADHART